MSVFQEYDREKLYDKPYFIGSCSRLSKAICDHLSSEFLKKNGMSKAI